MTDIDQPRYVDWGAIFVGAFIAAGISIILFQFGSAVGLASGIDTVREGASPWVLYAAALWVVAVSLIATGIGAYVAGRLRPRHPAASDAGAEFRDGVHGVAVWSISTVAVFGALAIGAFASSIAATVAGSGAEANQAADMTDLAYNSGVIAAFGTAAGAVVAAAAAWFAAIEGGDARDKNTPISELRPSLLPKSTS